MIEGIAPLFVELCESGVAVNYARRALRVLDKSADISDVVAAAEVLWTEFFAPVCSQKISECER
jgi:hypothetical protein